MNEKRILIKEVIAHCTGCSGAGENVCDNCNDWDTWNSCLTREQAIEKMAKAIFTQIWGLPNNRFDLAKSSVKVRNRKLAEAALNALLEEHK